MWPDVHQNDARRLARARSGYFEDVRIVRYLRADEYTGGEYIALMSTVARSRACH